MFNKVLDEVFLQNMNQTIGKNLIQVLHFFMNFEI